LEKSAKGPANAREEKKRKRDGTGTGRLAKRTGGKRNTLP